MAARHGTIWRRGFGPCRSERTALIAYRIEDDHVVITNLFYRGRDVDAAFAEDG